MRVENEYGLPESRDLNKTDGFFGIARRDVLTPKGMVAIFTITNKDGSLVELSTLGAGINRIMVPDRDGRLTDVVLGYGNDADFLYDSPCAGKTPGRFANRIAKGEFILDGVKHVLTRNDGENSLHGGPDGFHNRIWDYEMLDRGVRFTYLSPEGEEGYPGNLRVSVTYRWNDDNSLDIGYEAETDAPTVVNLTNHAYFNLGGVGSGDILRHRLMINGSTRVESDLHDIPTGRILPVDGTPFDFRRPKEIGRDIFADFDNLRPGKGYNHYFFIDRLDRDEEVAPAASLYCDGSGIALDVETTMPGLMLYTGNWLAQSPAGRGGYTYSDHDGVAMECQFPPDAPNQDGFPSTVLRPGERYSRMIRYRFSRYGV